MIFCFIVCLPCPPALCDVFHTPIAQHSLIIAWLRPVKRQSTNQPFGCTDLHFTISDTGRSSVSKLTLTASGPVTSAFDLWPVRPQNRETRGGPRATRVQSLICCWVIVWSRAALVQSFRWWNCTHWVAAAAVVKVKVHTLDIAPLRSESPPQKRSGMTRVLKGYHSFTCTPTCSSTIGMSHTCLCLPSYNWYSFTDHGGMEGWVDLGAK